MVTISSFNLTFKRIKSLVSEVECLISKSEKPEFLMKPKAFVKSFSFPEIVPFKPSSPTKLFHRY